MPAKKLPPKAAAPAASTVSAKAQEGLWFRAFGRFRVWGLGCRV